LNNVLVLAEKHVGHRRLVWVIVYQTSSIKINPKLKLEW
jgi:hypothetical protein